MTGTGKLIRLILRRDRLLLPLWVFILGVLPAGYVSTFNGLFPTEADRLEYARVSATNAGFVALYGPLEGSSLGELVAWRAGFLPVMIGLFALLTVIRHTRTDEEQGRTELVGAAAVGRHAQLAAALITTAAASVVLGGITALAMIGQGLPAAGSVWFGAELALSGSVFAAIATVAAQLTGSARSARGIAVLVLGVAYVLRLAGDISDLGSGTLSWLSWLSPVGWVQHIFPYGDNSWWPAVLTLLVAAAATGTGVVLLGRRDFGAGLLPSRPGPATAAPGLRSPLALAWRLHRGLLAGWVAGFAALGLVFGGVGDSVVDLAGSSSGLTEIFARMGGGSALVDSYFAAIAGMVGIIAACYAVQATLRLREEESTGDAEALLSTPVSRLGWVASHLVFSLLGPAVVLAVEGLAAGLTYGVIANDVRGQVPAILGGVLAQLPAVWVLTAIAVLLFGVLPRYAAAAWGALAACTLLLLVGTTLRLDQWVLDLSPFTHIPHLPGGRLSWTPLVAMTAVAAVVVAAGLTGFRRRDVPS
ncbi:MAG TPA: ABC transporter permease [Actinoplanes sp.]|nr:ABC transporter permease [Actinoplanes sp.]